jgi:hypothetical protein
MNSNMNYIEDDDDCFLLDSNSKERLSSDEMFK